MRSDEPCDDGIDGGPSAETLETTDDGASVSLYGPRSRGTNDLTKFDVIEEDDDMLKLTDNEWDTLAAAVQRLIAEKIISDKAWLDKVKQKRITISELTWFNTIAISRK